jgi:Mor family transcriptional regulator
MKEVVVVIEYILSELRRQPGVVIPDAAGTAAMVAAHQLYGGERLYIPKLPKLQNAARVQQQARHEGRKQVEIALASGLSVRQVRRLQRGR